jgi:hypothetical protein
MAGAFGNITSPFGNQVGTFPQNNSAFVNTNSSTTSPFANVKTVFQTQATPSQIDRAWDDASPLPASNKPGVGAGTTNNSFTSEGNDNNPGPNNAATQQALQVFSTSTNQLIQTQPNQLDQYASYTYAISWYLLSPQQYNNMVTTQTANVTGWQLLMQSGGAPIKGRSPAFSVDYYMDDLEILSKFPGGGKNMANGAVDIKFRVTEPNGITLIQSLFNAVKSVYEAAQASATANGYQNEAQQAADGNSGAVNTGGGDAPNYLYAQYCLVIQFYGYDSTGKLVAPARGSANGSYGQSAVITKYYPFRISDIKFAVANKAIEYMVTGKPIPYAYNSSSDRGTIPHAFTMTGQTVDQLLNGKPITTKNAGTPGERVTTPYVASLPMQQQAAIAAGTDPNAVDPTGMAFGGGGL